MIDQQYTFFLTSRPGSFQKTCTTETGVSDYHKCISTFFKSHYSKLKPKVIYYKNFDESLFLSDLEKTTFSGNSLLSKWKLSTHNRKFSKHAPLKKKIVRYNQPPFVNTEFRKAQFTLEWENPTSENELRYNQQRNKCFS